MPSPSTPFRVSAVCVSVLLVACAAYGQGTSTPPAASSTPPDAAAAEQQPGQRENEPEWRWRALTVGGDAAVTSAYVWRGFVLHDGSCLQPDIWASVSDFTVTSWLNVRDSIAGDKHVNEFDLIVDYSHDVGRVTLSAGWTNYRFFGLEQGHTDEFYAGVRADVPLRPGVQVYQDVGQGTGTYVSLSAGHEWPMGSRLRGSAQVAVGYNSHLYIDDSGFSDVAITFKLSVPLASVRAAIQPTITYSRSLMPELFPSRLFGGLSVAFK